jgi:hypothetical protein
VIYLSQVQEEEEEDKLYWLQYSCDARRIGGVGDIESPFAIDSNLHGKLPSIYVIRRVVIQNVDNEARRSLVFELLELWICCWGRRRTDARIVGGSNLVSTLREFMKISHQR